MGCLQVGHPRQRHPRGRVPRNRPGTRYLVYPSWHQRCVSYYGCGDFFRTSSNASVVFCNAIAPLTATTTSRTTGPGSVRRRSRSSESNPGRRLPGGRCPTTRTEPSPLPATRRPSRPTTTAHILRGCFEGWITWLHDVNPGYGSGDLWLRRQLVLRRWHDAGAEQYTSEVQGHLNNHIWLQPGFPNDRPGCHPDLWLPGARFPAVGDS